MGLLHGHPARAGHNFLIICKFLSINHFCLQEIRQLPKDVDCHGCQQRFRNCQRVIAKRGSGRRRNGRISRSRRVVERRRERREREERRRRRGNREERMMRRRSVPTKTIGDKRRTKMNEYRGQLIDVVKYETIPPYYGSPC